MPELAELLSKVIEHCQDLPATSVHHIRPGTGLPFVKLYSAALSTKQLATAPNPLSTLPKIEHPPPDVKEPNPPPPPTGVCGM